MRRPHLLCLVAKSPLPSVTGSRVRIKRLVEGLSELGTLTLVVGANVKDDERRLLESWDVGRVVIAPTPLRRPTVLERLQWSAGLGPERDWLYRTPAPVVEALRAELSRRPDVLWASGRWAACFLEQLPVPPLVVDAQAPERLALSRDIAATLKRLGPSEIPRLAQLVRDAPARLKAERQLWSRATLITPVSQQDAARVPPQWAHKVRIVVNGVDVPPPVAFTPGSRRIVFLGNMNYAPNADAARWIVEKILPRIVAARPDSELRLVGIAPDGLQASLTRPGVTFTGFVEDLRTVFADCSVALLALRYGAGTKLKVLEALAHGVPVVTTAIGSEGLNARDGVQLLVRESAADIAAAVLLVADNPELAASLGRAGREFVVRSHGWPHAAAELRSAIESMLNTQ